VEGSAVISRAALPTWCWRGTCTSPARRWTLRAALRSPTSGHTQLTLWQSESAERDAEGQPLRAALDLGSELTLDVSVAVADDVQLAVSHFGAAGGRVGRPDQRTAAGRGSAGAALRGRRRAHRGGPAHPVGAGRAAVWARSRGSCATTRPARCAPRAAAWMAQFERAAADHSGRERFGLSRGAGAGRRHAGARGRGRAGGPRGHARARRRERGGPPAVTCRRRTCPSRRGPARRASRPMSWT
jgi:hypothetical protein